MRRRRRTAPHWVRTLDDRQVHALAFMLRRDSMERDLSARQDWLLDRLIGELEWRAERDLRDPLKRACSCEFCFLGGPEEDDPDLLEEPF